MSAPSLVAWAVMCANPLSRALYPPESSSQGGRLLRRRVAGFYSAVDIAPLWARYRRLAASVVRSCRLEQLSRQGRFSCNSLNEDGDKATLDPSMNRNQ